MKIPTPLYHQVAEDLRSQVERGDLKPGEFLPTEKELEQIYNVSRTTVRAAIGQLINKGIVNTIHGKGNKVVSKPVRQDAAILNSFTNILKDQGFNPGLRALTIENIRAESDIAMALSLKPNTLTTRIERIRTADDEPISHQISYIPFNIGNRIDRELLTKSGSLYQVLDEQFGIKVIHAEDELFARLTEPQEIQLLNISSRDPVLVLQRTAIDNTGSSIEYATSVMRSDHYFYRATLSSGEN